MYLFDVRFLKDSFRKNFVCFLAALRIEKGLKDVDAVEEEEATFEVQLTKSDTKGKWLKDGKIIYPDQKYLEIFP
jgi:hypothetical protein